MIKKIDTNKYLEFLEAREYLEDMIVKAGRKISYNQDFQLKFISKDNIIEYHKKYIEKEIQ